MSNRHRSSLLGTTAAFFCGVALLSYLLGLRYVTAYSWPESLAAQIYVLAAFLGHLGAMAMLPWLLVVLPVTLVWPSARVVHPLSVVLGAATLAFLQVDGLVFAEDRFHLSALALRVLGAPTWIFAASSLLIALVACFFLLQVARRSEGRRRPLLRPRFAVSALVVSLLVSQAMHAWADVRYYVPITSFTPYLPLYRPLTSKHLLSRWLGSVDLNQARLASDIERLSSVQAGVLDYPKQPLRCVPPDPALNVLMVGLDAMRADAVSERITPQIARFARSATRFGSHWSGGNGTRPGLFSLFYGIPATYWNAFYAAQQPPVLIETFQAHGYEMAVFPSNPADRLVGLDRTAFRTISNLPSTRGDVAVTEGWKQWLAQREASRPFFAFLFYESAPGACPPEYPRVSEVDPSAPGDEGKRACYETALHFADAQVGSALAQLEAAGLLDRTVVIVTSDHGQEFNENGLGFRGHGSSYSEYQLKTPMLVRWPGRKPERLDYRTSHNDVAPTLLTRVLGCANPPSDYSSGQDLFAGRAWPWLVAASYTSHAILEPERITVSYGTYYEVRGSDYRLLDDPRIDVDALQAAMRETSRFIRK